MASTDVTGPTIRPEEIKAVPVRHPGRWVAAAIIAYLVVALAQSMATNSRFEWGLVRPFILSVDEGQTEAAHALGMTRLQTMRRIVLPQAMRVIIPPTGNETISMLKTTSLVSVIAYTELMYAVQLIYSGTGVGAYKQIPLLIVASLWYLIVTTVLSVGQYYVERYFGRGSSRQLPDTPLQRLRRNLFSLRHAEVELPGA